MLLRLAARRGHRAARGFAAAASSEHSAGGGGGIGVRAAVLRKLASPCSALTQSALRSRRSAACSWPAWALWRWPLQRPRPTSRA